MSRFLLVHGGWAGGWFWEEVVPFLEEGGHGAVAPDLPAHGADSTPVDEVDLDSYVDHVLARLDAEAEPVVLVGHSSGGVVITQAAEHRPEKVALLVYVCAFLPGDGESLLDLGRRDGEGLIVPNLVPSADGKSLAVRPDVVREALFADCSEHAHRAAVRRFRPEPAGIATATVRLTPEGFGRLPKAYVACSRDRALSPELQRSMYSAARCDPVVWMDTGHSPQYAAPRDLASHLVRLADGS